LLPHGPANKLGDRNTEGRSLAFRQIIFIFVQTYLRSDHVITLRIYDNGRADGESCFVRSGTPHHAA
jgi:hypothetical protein